MCDATFKWSTVNAYIFTAGQHKTYLQVVKFALSRCSFFKFSVLDYHHKINIIPWYIYKQLESTKAKQASHMLKYIQGCESF